MQTVLTFLEQNNLSKYCANFQKWDMDGDLLLDVDDSTLKEIGVAPHWIAKGSRPSTRDL